MSRRRSAGTIDAHVFEPAGASITGTIVTVHPWSTLGGGEHNTVGLARCITSAPKNAQEVSNGSWRVITFALKSDPIWKGGAVFGICSNHSYEVQQIAEVVNWASETYGGSIVLLGSSAGAPMAGTAMSKVLIQPPRNGSTISAIISVGYTFGNFASIAFGRHFSSLSSPSPFPPKLFIMGERDEFTSVDQLEKMAQKMRDGGDRVDTEIVADVGHFELESPGYDPVVANMVVEWLDKVIEG
ncbi:hypothetical protein ACHAXT_004620 [Thalassiosira profunda]